MFIICLCLLALLQLGRIHIRKLLHLLLVDVDKRVVHVTAALNCDGVWSTSGCVAFNVLVLDVVLDVSLILGVLVFDVSFSVSH